MWESLLKLFRIPDLKKRVIFTLLMLVIFRVGAHVPVPGIDPQALANVFSRGGLLSFLDMFAGGALSRFSILALGIMPYINASIIFQLLTSVVPKLEELAKSGEEGRDKIAQYTRWGTILLATVQGFGITVWLESMGVVFTPGIPYRITVILTLTAGSMFLMWLGELVSDYGIGNGISLIIFAGIVARIIPQMVSTVALIRVGEINPIMFILNLVFWVLIIAFVVLFQEAQRRIPVQYAKRVVGRRMYGGQSTHIPIRIIQGGVIPIIFASSILLFPATLAQFFQGSAFMKSIADALTPNSPLYLTIYAALIIFFTFFYTAVTFNPMELADNMKKYGGFIPGIRPGRPTVEYLDRSLSRITLWGALFLMVVAVLPDLLVRVTNVTTLYFGGTGIIIMVGVAIETVRQLEAQLLMRHYEGFIKK
ncbi:MAG TPA: preprotein translocase subunit SecY [Atribacter sp.]|jgi:preprotein translocase subunit SecY|uniref:Protein translocase subunit SecY n=1 Tax=Candidatus Atribacter allofermentans TaxID=1852833 RepID=A0A1V5T4T7_9BACT|nr:preprotein translocase subunit SecY [Atribacter sp.]MDD3713853.1 preprotein translocase subunit SecY [Atribacterota bacterium]OQA61533.1 MAG: preprotein translocase subunit SecY [Candidatus Atribacteria bacterium ADurb.Bin276]HHT11081.1 preprotein translocase subunit SecY [Candidatus Atribacteria bacterium]MDI9593976.1 preprotein translocase subunit SecY [Atribacterota bacterium]HQK84154.1 preprotein translocase subunit SecY [Atribacter sp.]